MRSRSPWASVLVVVCLCAAVLGCSSIRAARSRPEFVRALLTSHQTLLVGFDIVPLEKFDEYLETVARGKLTSVEIAVLKNVPDEDVALVMDYLLRHGYSSVKLLVGDERKP